MKKVERPLYKKDVTSQLVTLKNKEVENMQQFEQRVELRKIEIVKHYSIFYYEFFVWLLWISSMTFIYRWASKDL